MKAILRSSSFVSFIGTNLYWVPIKCHTGRRSCKCCSEEGFAIQNCTSWVREAWFSLTSGLVLKMRAMIGNVIFLFPVCLPISPSPSPQDLPVQPISSQASHAPFLSLQVVVRAVTSFTVSAHPPPLLHQMHLFLSVLQCIGSFNSSSAALWSPNNRLLFTPVPLLSSWLAVMSQRFTVVSEAAKLVSKCRKRTCGLKTSSGTLSNPEDFLGLCFCLGK